MTNLIICLQEPHVYGSRIPDLDPNLINFFSVSGGRPRAAVAVPRNSDWMMVEAVSSSDMAVCFKKDPGKKGLIVASVYMDIAKSIHSRELSPLLEYHDRTDSDLVICADSDAHSHLWG